MNIAPVRGLNGEQVFGRISTRKRAELIAAFKDYADFIVDRASLTSEIHADHVIKLHLDQKMRGETVIWHMMEKPANVHLQPSLPVLFRGVDIQASNPDDVANVLIRTYGNAKTGQQLAKALRNVFGS